MAHQQADLDWADGKVPVSSRFDDSYFSLVEGLAETKHVYLGGNALLARYIAAINTAAGFVRRGHSPGGFAVSRAPGFGRKRHMTQAVLA